jgi:hypothetical protein
VNWETTRTVLKVDFLEEELFPFKTFIVLKDERRNAG